MSIPKCLDFEDYNNYPADENPTTNAQMQSYLANQNDLVKQLASMVWQPNTNYEAGQVVYSSAMPNGVKAVVATAGTSGNEEPAWDSVGQYVSDSGVVWLMFDNSSEKVSKSGDTMTGNLTIKNNNIEYTDTTNSGSKCIEFTDKNGEKIADILCGVSSAGNNFIEFRVKDKSGTINEVLVARYNSTKERFEAYTKTMPTNDNSTCIATTAWVKSQGYTTPTEHTHDYLPLSGGTMSGAISHSSNFVVNLNNDANYVSIRGGGGSSTSDSPRLILYGKNYNNATNKGSFTIVATDGSKTSSLVGRPDGTFAWGGNDVVVVDSQTKSSNGYFKFSNGLIIQWGRGSRGTNNPATITLPIPFSNTNYSVVMTDTGSGRYAWGVTAKSANQLTAYGAGNDTNYRYIAIGY